MIQYRGKIRGYGLVRDNKGNPIIDSIRNIPEDLWKELTEKEKKELKSRGENNGSNT